jgi:hypothetical protein
MSHRRWWLGFAASGVAALAAASTLIAGAANEPSASGTVLTRGWNNVAYMGTEAETREALASIDGKYKAVYQWSASEQEYRMYSPQVPDFANSLPELKTGDSIWIDVTADNAQLSTGAQSGPKTGVLSIVASSFVPASDLALYEKKFNQLSPASTDLASHRYYAPLHLPQGATITSMKAAFASSGSAGVQIRLDYTALGNADSDTGPVYKLAEVLSTAGPSPMTVQAFSHVVDNSANVYFLVVDLTGGPAAKLFGVSVAYTMGAQ